MDGSQPVKLFRHGDGHAVDIPAGFTLPGENAVMRQKGKRLIIEPATRKPSLKQVLAKLALEPPLGPEEQLEPFVDAPARPFSL